MVWGAIASVGLGLLSRRDNKKNNNANKKAQNKANKQNRQWQKEDRAEDRAAYLADVERARAEQLGDMSTQFSRLRDAAQAGGFNPLSVLGSPMVPGAMGPMGPGVGGVGAMAAVSSAPPLASYQLLADGFTGVSDWATGKDAANRAEQAARTELMRVEAERLKAAVPIGGGAPGAVPIRTPASTSMILESGAETLTNPNTLDPNRHYVNPRRTDAETAEQRYGDLAQEVHGAVNAASDAYYDFRLQRIAREYGRETADAIHTEFGSSVDKNLTQIIRDHVGPVRVFTPSLSAPPAGYEPSEIPVSP